MEKEKAKNIHAGHRQRIKLAVDNDSELDSFSDHEVLEYLLSFLIPRRDTNPIAHELIETFGNLFGVFTASPEDLFKINGMTKNAAHLLPNLTAVIRKAELSRVKCKQTIRHVDAAVKLLTPYFMNRNSERCYIVCLDINDRLIQVCFVGDGIANFSVINIQKIVAAVTRLQASKVILAHNHPGGTRSPSREDYAATSALALVLNTMGTYLIDHIIFTSDGYYSFYQNDDMSVIFSKNDNVFGTDNARLIRSRRTNGEYMLERDPVESRYNQS